MLSKLVFIGSALSLSFAASAQDYAIPPGHENEMGGERGQHLFAFENIRYQQISGELTNKVNTWNSLSFRREQLGLENTGRSWTKMTINVGQGDFATFGNTFSTNLAGTPTMVFNKAVSVPGHSTGGINNPASEPPSYPTTWGQFVSAGDMKFPFSAPVMHDGKKGIVLDFMLTGGKLKNSVAWGATTQRPYYTDGDWQASTPFDSRSSFGRVTSACRATGKGGVPGLRPFFSTTATNSTSTVYPSDHVGFEFRYQNLENNRPAIGVVSFSGFGAGQPFPGSCEKLFLDLSKPFLMVPFMAAGNGAATLRIASVRYKPIYASLRIDTQAAWDDSKKGLQLGSREWVRIRPRTDASMSKRNYNFGSNAGAKGGRAGSPYTSLIASILLGK